MGRASQYEIRRRQACRIGQHNLKISDRIGIRVAVDVREAICCQFGTQLTSYSRKCGHADKIERLIATQRVIGINTGQADLVAFGAAEVGDPVCRAHQAFGECVDAEGVCTRAPRKGIEADATDQNIIASIAPQGVIAET